MLASLLLPLVLAAGPALPGIDADDKIPEGVIPPDLVFETDEDEVTEHARVFVEVLVAGRADLLANLVADPFSFDGRLLEGRKAIRAAWQAVLERSGRSLQRAGKPRIQVLDHAAAVARFGPPPAKFAQLKLEDCLFAAINFPKRDGLLLVLRKGVIQGEGWSIIAATD